MWDGVGRAPSDGMATTPRSDLFARWGFFTTLLLFTLINASASQDFQTELTPLTSDESVSHLQSVSSRLPSANSSISSADHHTSTEPSSVSDPAPDNKLEHNLIDDSAVPKEHWLTTNSNSLGIRSSTSEMALPSTTTPPKETGEGAQQQTESSIDSSTSGRPSTPATASDAPILATVLPTEMVTSPTEDPKPTSGASEPDVTMNNDDSLGNHVWSDETSEPSPISEAKPSLREVDGSRSSSAKFMTPLRGLSETSTSFLDDTSSEGSPRADPLVQTQDSLTDLSTETGISAGVSEEIEGPVTEDVSMASHSAPREWTDEGSKAYDPLVSSFGIGDDSGVQTSSEGSKKDHLTSDIITNQYGFSSDSVEVNHSEMPLKIATGFEDLGESSTPTLEELITPLIFTYETTTKIPLVSSISSAEDLPENVSSEIELSTFISDLETAPDTDEIFTDYAVTNLTNFTEFNSSEQTAVVSEVAPVFNSTVPDLKVKDPELYKPHEDLTRAESNNAVTVIFLTPPDKKMDVFWDEDRNWKFRNIVASSINAQEFKNWNGGNNSLDDAEETSSNPNKTFNWMRPDDLVYINPSPVADNRTIYVAFFIRNFSSSEPNALISSDRIVYALNKNKMQLQEEIGLNVSQITKGIILIKVLEPLFIRHAIVFISLLAVAVVCIIIIIITLIYIRCRSSRRKWDKGEYGDQHKLKRDMKLNSEIGDLHSDRDIQSDEMREKNGHPRLNGNGMPVISLQDEGWVLPYDQAQKGGMEIEDTKL